MIFAKNIKKPRRLFTVSFPLPDEVHIDRGGGAHKCGRRSEGNGF